MHILYVLVWAWRGERALGKGSEEGLRCEWLCEVTDTGVLTASLAVPLINHQSLSQYLEGDQRGCCQQCNLLLPVQHETKCPFKVRNIHSADHREMSTSMKCQRQCCSDNRYYCVCGLDHMFKKQIMNNRVKCNPNLLWFIKLNFLLYHWVSLLNCS